MHTKQLQSMRDHVQAALSDMNWRGLFSQPVRDETLQHRMRTATHLQSALKELDKELEFRKNKPNRRSREKASLRRDARLPYKDD